jgi:hypothetical protein
MTDSAFWRDLHDKFVAFQDRLRASSGATCLTYKQFEVLAKRGASEIARPGTSNLLSVWLEAVWKEDPDFGSLYLPKEVSSLSEFEQNFEIGTLDHMCHDSATFCKKLEDQAVQAEFEENQRSNLGNGSVEIDHSGKLLVAVLGDIRERFLRDAAILRIESREGVCDRLTHDSDPNGALNDPYKVASAGFTGWVENLGKFAAGHVMTLARMAQSHSEWGVADPAEWARIQVAEFVDDELYPKRCRKCGKSRSKHSDTDHEFSKAMSRVELWWRTVSGEEEDFDLYDYGRPERWSAPGWIRKDPKKTADFLRARHFNLDERLKWVLHDAEGDARIKLCLVSVKAESVAELAPGTPNPQPLRLANGNSKPPAQPVKIDSDAWIRRADELLAKHPSANYHRASELYQFATSMLSTLYGVESPEMQSLRSNAESASRDKSASQARHISLLAQGAIKAARDDLKAGLTGNLKSAPEIVPVSTREGAVTGGLLSSYRSEIKRAILTQLALNPKATDGEICRGLDADGSVELRSSWKSKVSDRGFFDAYSDAVRRHRVEVTISKVRKDLRKRGLLE